MQGVQEGAPESAVRKQPSVVSKPTHVLISGRHRKLSLTFEQRIDGEDANSTYAADNTPNAHPTIDRISGIRLFLLVG